MIVELSVSEVAFAASGITLSPLETRTFLSFFFFNDTATTEIYTLPLHDALPIYSHPPGGARLGGSSRRRARRGRRAPVDRTSRLGRAFRHGGRARRVPGGRRSPRARARSSAGIVGVRGAGRPGAAGGFPSHPPLRPRSYGNAPPGCGVRARDGHDRGARRAVQLVDRGHVVSRHGRGQGRRRDRKSTRLNSSHGYISYAVFCLKKKNKKTCM